MNFRIVLLTFFSVIFFSACTVKSVFKPPVTEEYLYPFPFAQKHQALPTNVTQMTVVNQSDVVDIVAGEQYVYWVSTPPITLVTEIPAGTIVEEVQNVVETSNVYQDVPVPDNQIVQDVQNLVVIKKEISIVKPVVKDAPEPHVVIIDGETILIGPEEDCF